MKKCKPFEKQLTAYLHGELDERKVHALEAHLEGCEACRAELAAQRATLDLLGETLEATPAPEKLSARHAVPQRSAAPRSALSDYWFSPRLKTALVTAAACSVVIFAGIGLLIPRMGGGTYNASEEETLEVKEEAVPAIRSFLTRMYDDAQRQARY